MYMCCSHLHSLCMPCAARADRVVVGSGIVAASVPHSCLYDPWNPLISELQAPEAAPCTDVNATPHALVCTQTQYIQQLWPCIKVPTHVYVTGLCISETGRASELVHARKERRVELVSHLQK